MKRIVFISIVALLGVATVDRRILMDTGGPLDHRPYPLPVFGWTGARTQEDPGKMVRIGVIEYAAVCDRRLIVFGRLYSSEQAAPHVERLKSGETRLEIDVDQVESEVVPDRMNTPSYPFTRFTRWRLVCAFAGENPCWDLPRVQIEELTS